MSLRRLCRPWSARRTAAAVALAAALLWAARRLCAPALLRSAAHFPRAPPAALAHLLADFSTYPLPFRGTWTVEDEKSNYTSWHYVVSYECGTRCTGRAQVEAHDEPLPLAAAAPAAPRHGLAARAHRVRFQNIYCIRLPLLPWPQFCGELETITDITAASDDASGATLVETASTRCGGALAALALLGRCGDARALRELRDEHLQRLRVAVAGQ